MFAVLLNKQQTTALKRPSVFALAHHAHPGAGDRVRRSKMALRLLLFFRYHRKVESIFNDFSLQEIPLANPRIYKKIYREYLYHGATMADRVRLLELNYRFVREVFDRSWITSIYVQRDFTLCSIVLGEDSEKLSVRLGYDERFAMEGELTLGLFDERDSRLYSVSFNLQANGRKRTAVIGCMIGRGSSDEEDKLLGNLTVKRLTKGLHGMRPKNLALFLLQALCRHLGVQAIQAVGLNSHIYSGSTKKRGRIKFGYDEFWEEVGGYRSEDDQRFFSLPIQDVRRSFDEMRSNKRAIYLRRYAFLDDLDAQIQNSMSPVGPNPIR